MSEWREVSLGEITDKIGSGATPKGGGESYKESGISLIRSQNVLDFKFSRNGLAFIDDTQAHELRNVSVEKDDVLLNITGDSVTRCCVVPENILPARVNQHVAIIRANKEITDNHYIYYSIQALKEELLMQSEIGATRNALTKGMLESLKIAIPALEEQKAIASVLSSLDDKIDLLHRQNTTLEHMAETLFRQWFVEEAQVDWAEKPLNFYGEIVCGKTPSKQNHSYFNGVVPFIKIPDMHGNPFIFKTEDTLTELGKNSQNNKTVPPYSICVSCIATVGLVSITTKPSQTNQQINTIIPKHSKYRYFLYLTMKASYDLLHAEASGGTATLNLNTGNFSRIAVPLPPDNLLLEFESIVDKVFNKIYQNQAQIQTLEKLRDNLLPKLISGEVRVA